MYKDFDHGQASRLIQIRFPNECVILLSLDIKASVEDYYKTIPNNCPKNLEAWHQDSRCELVVLERYRENRTVFYVYVKKISSPYTTMKLNIF